jgi:hypothetical protein
MVKSKGCGSLERRREVVIDLVESREENVDEEEVFPPEWDGFQSVHVSWK